MFRDAPALLMVALLAPVTALAQQWKVYSYPDSGFSIQFPAAPTVQNSTYKTAAGGMLPMVSYSANLDRSVYSLSVVDYSTINADDKSTIAEAERSLGASGKVIVALDARVNRAFGRELSISGKDGGRSAVAIFFVNKHLYTLLGEALPPDAIRRSGDLLRFQESLQFAGNSGGVAGRFGSGVRRGGPFNPEAVAACAGKVVGDDVQLNGPAGPMPATCTLIARPNMPPDGPPGPPPRTDGH